MLFLEYLLDYENSHMQMGIKPHTQTITLNSAYIDFSLPITFFYKSV